MTAPATTGGGRAPRPSAVLDRAAWARAHDDQFLALFHGDDERVSVEALRFGLPVLHDVVRRFCG
jgi:hypothetical protein